MFLVCIDALRVIYSGESKPTRIMYKIGSTRNTTLEALKRLSAMGYIQEVGKGRHHLFIITDKGRQAIQAYTAHLQNLRQVA